VLTGQLSNSSSKGQKRKKQTQRKTTIPSPLPTFLSSKNYLDTDKNTDLLISFLSLRAKS